MRNTRRNGEKAVAADVVRSGDYDWITYGSFGIAGSGGDDGNGNWGLSSGARLSLFVYGYSANMKIPLARVYGDNFSVTGAVSP